MTEKHGTRPPRGLRLHPFRGMRFNPVAVGDVGDVTSPPYDVMDRHMIERLLEEHPRNIVRLILPRFVDDPVRSGDPYGRAAALLERWRARSVLLTDPEKGLYVYEYGDDTDRICGLVGVIGLRRPSDRVILPHEGVIPEIVADRLAMMKSAKANLEPILLVYDGQGETKAILDEARSRPPLIDVATSDGSSHRLWQVTDPTALAQIATALSPYQALIADGHHRYATYLQYRKWRRRKGADTGPWDRGLALLIDQSQYPLRLAAIHRSISEVDLNRLTVPVEFVLGTTNAVDPSGPQPSAEPGSFVLTDGTSQRLVSCREARPTAVSDAELLHERLLPHWGITENRIAYHHGVEQALRAAAQDSGLAILVHPIAVEEVMDVARAGKVMPRKSTSFGPKPRMGIVMAALDDQE
ncbi:MAG: DUF1015 domain-containing protein [Nocardioidaceae bacterium]